MRVFACLIYVRNIKTNRDKFEVRGRPGVFIGYPQGQKGYKVFNIDNKKSITSRDAKFVEDVFPFLTTKIKKNKDENEDFFIRLIRMK